MNQAEGVNGIMQSRVTAQEQVSSTQKSAESSQKLSAPEKTGYPATKSMTKADGTVVSQDGDTLNISGADHSSVRKLSSDGSGSMSASGMKAGGTAGAKAGGANVAISAASGSDSDSSDDNTNDLSQYTASELRTMLSNGEITEQEYQSELEKRSTQKKSDNAEQNTLAG
ncbi:MAG: hypothetical protein LKF52_13220 [Butyrivibrio sp.]|jgi:hypothetical protein|nr:hypothetical protein [Butyrivibrio sp.]